MKRGMIHLESGKMVTSRRERKPKGFVAYVPVDDDGKEFFDLSAIFLKEEGGERYAYIDKSLAAKSNLKKKSWNELGFIDRLKKSFIK